MRLRSAEVFPLHTLMLVAWMREVLHGTEADTHDGMLEVQSDGGQSGNMRTASAAACASASAAFAAASSAWWASDAAPDSRAAFSSASLPFSRTCARACAHGHASL